MYTVVLESAVDVLLEFAKIPLLCLFFTVVCIREDTSFAGFETRITFTPDVFIQGSCSSCVYFSLHDIVRTVFCN